MSQHAQPRFALQCRSVRHPARLPIDAPLPAGGARRLVVVAALAIGGLVAILVPVFFAVALFGMLRS